MVALRVRSNQLKAAMTGIILLAAAGLAFLAIVVSGQALTDLDLRITLWVQALKIPGLDPVSTFLNLFTGAYMAIALWLVVTIVFVLRGRPLEAIAVFSISGLWLANMFLGFAVDRPAVPTGAAGAVEFSRVDSGGFPSGHVTGTIAFYGLLSFLTVSNLRGANLRLFTTVLALSMIGLVSLIRVYYGAHWASDVLGSYLLSFMGLVGIAWMYISVREDRFHLPRLGKRRPVSTAPGVTVAGSIASKVYLDSNAGTATKVYNPPWLIRALYWLAFQAPFPYKGRGEALEAAAAKRKIAGLLTKHRYGRDMVAAVYEVRNGGESYRFVTELIPGSEPRSNREVAATLTELYSYFQEVGLPTWQVAPGNPHAHSNFIRNPGGELKLIDLESSILSISPPFRQLRAALRDGNFPVFDDVDFVQLNRYVTVNSSDLRRSLSPREWEELHRSISAAQAASDAWKRGEPRVWGRLARLVYRSLDFSRFYAGIGRRLNDAEAMAAAFLNSAVDRWHLEGRIDAAQAASLRDNLASSEVERLRRHLGAHVILTLVLRFPFGSIFRFAWVAGFRFKARYDLAKGTMTKAQYRQSKRIHTLPVMLISLVPLLGTVAYLASGTVRKSGVSRMFIDQSAYKLPFRLYSRLGLAHIAAPRLPKAAPAATPVPNPTAVRAEVGYATLMPLL